MVVKHPEANAQVSSKTHSIAHQVRYPEVLDILSTLPNFDVNQKFSRTNISPLATRVLEYFTDSPLYEDHHSRLEEIAVKMAEKGAKLMVRYPHKDPSKEAWADFEYDIYALLKCYHNLEGSSGVINWDRAIEDAKRFQSKLESAARNDSHTPAT